MVKQHNADISLNAKSLARAVDRALQHPGQYQIQVCISPYPPYTWDVTISRVDHLFRILKSNRALTIADEM
jgi:hypothetical protein